MTEELQRPTPVPQPESDLYWTKIREGELWLRRCDDCRKAYFYPRDFCPHCHSRNTSWVKASGRGRIHTFTIVHRGPTPAFRALAPYIAAIVELNEDGARFPTNIVGVEPDPANLHIGMPVEVTFEEVSAEVTLPMFRPLREG